MHHHHHSTEDATYHWVQMVPTTCAIWKQVGSSSFPPKTRWHREKRKEHLDWERDFRNKHPPFTPIQTISSLSLFLCPVKKEGMILAALRMGEEQCVCSTPSLLASPLALHSPCLPALPPRTPPAMAASESSHWNKGIHRVGMSLPRGEKAQAMHIWINSARWVAPGAFWWLYYFSVWSSNRDRYLITAAMLQDLLCKDYQLGFCEVFKHNQKAAETHGRHPCKQNTDMVSNQHSRLEQSRNIFLWAQGSTLWVGLPTASWGPKIHTTVVREQRLWRGTGSPPGVKILRMECQDRGCSWEFQIRPCEGMDLGQHLWVDNFILHHV